MHTLPELTQVAGNIARRQSKALQAADPGVIDFDRHGALEHSDGYYETPGSKEREVFPKTDCVQDITQLLPANFVVDSSIEVIVVDRFETTEVLGANTTAPLAASEKTASK